MKSLPLLMAVLLLTAGTAAAEPGEPYTLAGFRALVGENFRVWGGQGDTGLVAVERVVLEEVLDLGSNATVEQFEVRFRADAGSRLRKTVYSFESDDGRTIQLFIEPDGEDAAGRYFVSRFSQLVKAPY